jgi:hypothetical protein
MLRRNTEHRGYETMNPERRSEMANYATQQQDGYDHRYQDDYEEVIMMMSMRRIVRLLTAAALKRMIGMNMMAVLLTTANRRMIGMKVIVLLLTIVDVKKIGMKAIALLLTIVDVKKTGMKVIVPFPTIVNRNRVGMKKRTMVMFQMNL